MVICAVLVAGVVSPGLARDYQQEEKRYLERYHDDLEAYNDALREKECLLREKEKALQEVEQRQQYAVPPSAPPAGEFAPVSPASPPEMVVLVPQSYYFWDNYYRGYVRIYLSCPPWWIAPYDWVLISPGVWLPPVFVGTVWSRWDRERIVINNIAVHSGVNHTGFRNHIQERFGRHSSALPQSVSGAQHKLRLGPQPESQHHIGQRPVRQAEPYSGQRVRSPERLSVKQPVRPQFGRQPVSQPGSQHFVGQRPAQQARPEGNRSGPRPQKQSGGHPSDKHPHL